MTVSAGLGSAALAVGVFAATNIDDVLVLTVLFVSSRTGRPRRSAIIAGQYLGFSVLLGASLGISFGLLALDERWVRLLGLL